MADVLIAQIVHWLFLDAADLSSESATVLQCQNCEPAMITKVQCPLPTVEYANTIGHSINIESIVRGTLSSTGIPINTGNVFLGNVLPDISGVSDVCGTCSIWPKGVKTGQNDGNIGIVSELRAEYDFPENIHTFEDFLLRKSCMEQVESERISFRSENGQIRYLTNYQPGTEQCDRLVQAYCMDGENINDPQCVCFKEEQDYLSRFGQTPIPFPVQCLGKCADDPDAYKLGRWIDQDCDVEICADLVSINGNSIISAGDTSIVCDGNTYIVDPNVAPPDVFVTETPITGISAGTEYILISIGTVYLILFFAWIALYIRSKV